MNRIHFFFFNEFVFLFILRFITWADNARTYYDPRVRPKIEETGKKFQGSVSSKI
jgi:hypothetical protein